MYDTSSLPSQDSRFKTAAQDINKHRVLNDDWSPYWVFNDTRFDVLGARDDAFLAFLCEMIHPLVRPNREEVDTLQVLFNKYLAADNWEIKASDNLSGRPVFASHRVASGGGAAISSARIVTEALNATYIARQVSRMASAVTNDPDLAIGTAKEFIETIAKTILRECDEEFKADIDLPQLVKKARDLLPLLPADAAERTKGTKTIERLLGSLSTIVQGIAELRSLYGTGHGKVARSKGLEARHARLAVGASCALGTFLYEAFEQRKKT